MDWLCSLKKVLSTHGCLIASVSHTTDFLAWMRDRKDGRRAPFRPSFRAHGVQSVDAGRLRKWCRESGLDSVRVIPSVWGSERALRRAGIGPLRGFLATRFLVKARPAA
jgi:hypothetical protein